MIYVEFKSLDGSISGITIEGVQTLDAAIEQATLIKSLYSSSPLTIRRVEKYNPAMMAWDKLL